MTKHLLVVLLLAPLTTAIAGEFNLAESTIADMQQAMTSGRLTSRELVQRICSASRSTTRSSTR
jgi:hypothetical protein